MVTIRTAFDLDSYIDPGIDCSHDGRTHQSMTDETDINLIMAKYVRTGVMDFVNVNQPLYGDIPAVDYHLALDTVARAESMFMDMPAELRKEFSNDPYVFLDFVQDDKNRDKAIELGLINPKVVAPATAGSEPPTPPAGTPPA